MTDIATKKPVQVRNEGTAGPYVRVPLDQVKEIEKLLNTHGIYYWVSEDAISFDNGPFITEINFGRKGDARAIQKVFDSAN